jgi:hypothetical protein
VSELDLGLGLDGARKACGEHGRNGQQSHGSSSSLWC